MMVLCPAVVDFDTFLFLFFHPFHLISVLIPCLIILRFFLQFLPFILDCNTTLTP
jgi:hypothetical protein